MVPVKLVIAEQAHAMPARIACGMVGVAACNGLVVLVVVMASLRRGLASLQKGASQHKG